jgi:hypothetical protein
VAPDLKEDFALWGDCYLAKSEYANDGTFLNGLHSANPRLLAEYQRKFKILEDRAIEFGNEGKLVEVLGQNTA